MVCDPGTDCIIHPVKKILNDRGTDLRVAMVETPEQNGAAERRTAPLWKLQELLFPKKELPEKLWAEACSTAAYVLTQTGPTPVDDKTQYELWHGKPENFNIKRLRIFGTNAMHMNQNKDAESGIEKQSVEGLFVGYEAHDRYRVFIHF
ncbi:hypothetical protein AVEN_149745-1 [Araneus ventricosus]|uniref:Integrase catalytic domain-containing protein n=1 Tax=Araneus ventricosus TaxID=182803 RepID=A0A4Y2TLW7_ARAVE|nr:hypothetical protein AVEN_149745-1 [Araneus ventricosus]